MNEPTGFPGPGEIKGKMEELKRVEKSLKLPKTG